ncbi:MAG: response regulator [Acidobacteriota bacterium]
MTRFVNSPDGDPSAGPKPDESTRRRPLVLVVEDDDALRETLCEVLEDEGLRAVGATNGLHALSLLENLPRPDLIILDLMMPVMNGWEFHERLKSKEHLSTVPVLLLSAYVQRETHTGPQDVEGALQKPVSVDDLMGWVRRLIARMDR